jgi:signal transduction histidine kinase
MSSGMLELRITDDGIGFILSRLDKRHTTSLGLLSMQERAHLVGGQVYVTSALGHGTEVIGTLPAQPRKGSVEAL